MRPLPFLVALSLSAGAAHAATSQTISLAVDASEAARRILHGKLTIPASAGPLTLLYPKWIPGEHSPTGPLVDLVGIRVSAGGKTIPWERDPVEMFALHVVVPDGARAVEVAFDFLPSHVADGFTAGASTTGQLTVISWNQLLLYPQGPRLADLKVQASLKLPPSWRFGTALPVARETRSGIEFRPTELLRFVDSPLIAGVNFRVFQLAAGTQPPHQLDVAADGAAALDAPPEVIGHFSQLVLEAGALFGTRHYDQYHFLLSLSDHVAHFGVEHEESSDNRASEKMLVDEATRNSSASLLAHEFVHSWNGKFRRPADLTNQDLLLPAKTGLLWIYEGLTQHLGYVLSARSGIWSQERYREWLAETAAWLEHRPGRTWRPLADTAVAAQIQYGAPQEWASWRRGVDFYNEGALIWLEVDVLLRQLSHGKSSLDDFCQRFFGGQGGYPAQPSTYVESDVIAALNQLAPYDWPRFFSARVQQVAPHAPTGGIESAGWRIVYTDALPTRLKDYESSRKMTDVSFSVGLLLKDDGTLADVIPNLPGARAGLAPGMKLIAVDGRQYSAALLRAALRRAMKSKAPIELLAQSDDYYKTYRLDYHGGERYPHLERDPKRPDLLAGIVKSLAPPK